MKTASASETPIAGAVLAVQRAETGGVLAPPVVVVAAAEPAQEPPRPAVARSSAMEPAVLGSPPSAERTVWVVDAAIGPAGLGSSHSAERAAAVVAAAMEPAGPGSPRSVEHVAAVAEVAAAMGPVGLGSPPSAERAAAAVVAAGLVPALLRALTVLSEVRQVAPVPVWAAPEQAVALAGPV